MEQRERRVYYDSRTRPPEPKPRLKPERHMRDKFEWLSFTHHRSRPASPSVQDGGQAELRDLPSHEREGFLGLREVLFHMILDKRSDKDTSKSVGKAASSIQELTIPTEGKKLRAPSYTGIKNVCLVWMQDQVRNEEGRSWIKEQHLRDALELVTDKTDAKVFGL